MNRTRLPYTPTDAKSWASAHVRGFYEAPITPLTRDFEIDEKAIHQIADTYSEWGIPAIVVGGNVSEGWNMTPKEWEQLHAAWADAAAGRMDLWTIVLDPSPRVAAERMSFVEELGYTGAEVMNPVAYLVTDNEMLDYFSYLNAHANLAIWLYRTPVTKVMMSLDMVRRIAELDLVVGVKEGSLIDGDAEQLMATCPEDFTVSWPVERHYQRHVESGGQVLWATFFYTVYGKKRHLLEEYVALAEQGRHDEAARLSAQLNDARDIIDQVIGNRVKKLGSYAASIASIKGWFEAVGLPAGPVLPPLAPLSGAEREDLHASLTRAGLI
jgi:4-hydroxy-tetrahydrodipicolinate synthase